VQNGADVVALFFAEFAAMVYGRRR